MEKREFNALISKINKSERAFETLYDFYYKRIVYRLSRSYGRELAEDVAHEFFLNLIKSDKPVKEVDSPAAWIYACCENLAKTKIRKERETPIGEFYEGNPAENFTDGMNADVKAALSFLDEISRKIVYMHYWEGYGFEEISEILGVSYAAVRQKHKRLKAALKNIL